MRSLGLRYRLGSTVPGRRWWRPAHCLESSSLGVGEHLLSIRVLLLVAESCVTAGVISLAQYVVPHGNFFFCDMLALSYSAGVGIQHVLGAEVWGWGGNQHLGRRWEGFMFAACKN